MLRALFKSDEQRYARREALSEEVCGYPPRQADRVVFELLPSTSSDVLLLEPRAADEAISMHVAGSTGDVLRRFSTISMRGTDLEIGDRCLGLSEILTGAIRIGFRNSFQEIVIDERGDVCLLEDTLPEDQCVARRFETLGQFLLFELAFFEPDLVEALIRGSEPPEG